MQFEVCRPFIGVMMMSTTLLLLLLLLLSFASPAAAATSKDDNAHSYLRPGIGSFKKSFIQIKRRETVVPGSYVVLVQQFADIKDILADYGLESSKIYRHVLTGFAVDRMTEQMVLELLLDPRVDSVAEDGLMDEEEDVNDVAEPPPPPPVRVQSPATWNLDRLDGKGGDFEYQYRYNGTGVHVYILDSGVRATNVEFENRVTTECFDEVGPCNTDNNGHGSHVAGIVGGKTYGVAKGVTIHDVRIRDQDNALRWAYLYSGLDYVVAEKQRYPDRKLLINVSYSGSTFDVADQAAQVVLDAGITIIAAAGNQNEDSCTRSPARVPGVIAVGNMAEGDVRAETSNSGACISLWAPGRNILAAGHVSDEATATKTGTSMAAPTVSGALALYLSAGWTLENLLADAEYVPALADENTTGKLVSIRNLVQSSTRSPTTSPTTTFPATDFPTTVSPTNSPTIEPTFAPTEAPTEIPSDSPTAPTVIVTNNPTEFPTFSPVSPTQQPSTSPSSDLLPSNSPSMAPSAPTTDMPSVSQSPSLSTSPSLSVAPTRSPEPTESPTNSSAPTSSQAPTFPRAGGGGDAGTLTPTVSPSASVAPSVAPTASVDRDIVATATTTTPSQALVSTLSSVTAAPDISSSAKISREYEVGMVLTIGSLICLLLLCV